MDGWSGRGGGDGGGGPAAGGRRPGEKKPSQKSFGREREWIRWEKKKKKTKGDVHVDATSAEHVHVDATSSKTRVV